MKILLSSIEQISKQLREGVVTAKDICEASLKRAKHIKELNAFVTLTEDLAKDQAEESNNRFEQRKPKGELDGVPFAIKDNFCTKGIVTTCGSRMLQDFVPSYDATVVQKLFDGGATLLGKCNLDEFAMGSGTVDSIHGPTRNIWCSNINYTVGGEQLKGDKGWRIAGGSSGGCAVAVASGTCFAAIGSDTGGSTRNPASYCGIVGLKPTYSSVSRHGLIPLVNSMDVPGILTRTVDDAALVYNVICGHDPKDSTTTTNVQKVDLSKEFHCNKVRIGLPVEFFNEKLSEEVVRACEYVMDLLEEAGAAVIPITMPHTEYSIACYSVLNQCEVASNMARYDGLRYGHRADETYSTNKLYAETRREGFNKVVRERILAGNYFLLKRNYSKYFEKALKIRRLITEDFKRAWDCVDVILTPTTLTEAPLFEDYIRLDNREQCSIHDFCTQPANMSGCPAVSIPVRLSGNGLPLSVQLMAPNFSEQILLSVAKWLEEQVRFPKLEIRDQ